MLVWLKKVRFINVAHINRLFHFPSAYIIVLALPGNSAVTQKYIVTNVRSQWDYSQMNVCFSFQCILRNNDVSEDYVVIVFSHVQHLE